MEKLRIPVRGKMMAYVDVGEGDPVFFLNANPTSSNQTDVTVPGIHFIQEDSADGIGTALADWMRHT